MKKILRVYIDKNLASGVEIDEQELTGKETEEEIEDMAHEMFWNHCNYDFEVVEE